MRRPANPTLLLIPIAAAGCAPPAQQPLSNAERAEIEQMLFGWEEQWIQTAFSRDASHLERILADDMTYVDGEGAIIGKQEMIDFWIDDPNTYTSWVIDDLYAYWYGDDVVSIVGSDTNRGTDAEGAEFVATGRFTNVFLRRDGRWQMSIGQYTPAG